jgi:DNA-directed RNA polymerase III subunit RPC3
MSHGRLNIPSIVHYTNLTGQQIKHGLAILVQQHLALWSTDETSSSTYYEADWLGAYSLVRSGKFIQAAGARFGAQPESIFSDCILSGHVRVGDLEQASNFDHEKLSNGTNGINGKDARTLESMHASLYTLLQHGFLSLAHDSHFRSEAENTVRAEATVRRTYPQFQDKVKTTARDEFEAAVLKKLKAWRYGSSEMITSIQQHRLHVIPKGTKRHFDEDAEENHQPPSKMARIGNGEVNGKPSSKAARANFIHRDIVIRVNNDKFTVAARSDRLVQLVEERIGLATSKVYSAVIRSLEKTEYRCGPMKRDIEKEYDEAEILRLESRGLESVTTADLIQSMNEFQFLRGSIGPMNSSKFQDTNHRKKSRRESDSNDDSEDNHSASGEKILENHESESDQAEDFDSDDELDRQSHRHIIHQHLRLLAEHPYQFLTHHRRGTEGKKDDHWSIPYAFVSHKLRLEELNKAISSRFGPSALRVVRLLQEKGRLDEKAIGTFSFLDNKVLRSTIASLHKAGYLDVQEIPRDSSRQPSKTIYLWFFDEHRCAKKLTQDTYQAMSRCLQRLKVERDSMRDVLDKASRTDVVGREQKLLASGEWQSLQEWRRREEQILGEVGRLDDIVLVLRDL